MSRKRLWVVDPSKFNPEDQGVDEILRDWPGESRVLRPVLEPGSGPDATTDHETDGIVVMGSACSVYDDESWIAPLSDWLAPVISGEVRVPLLGICFGHQLLAHLGGAPVGFLAEDRAKTVGVEQSRLEGGRLLPGAHDLRVVVSHREEVKELPAGYRVTAHRGPVEIDGLEHERLPLFSFQFHPEARDEFAERNGIAASEIDSRLREESERVLAAFRRLVLS
ncbi:MAG: hypothetical protein GY716_09570 [bacterium]|nr:hypothetical protein [bacterium]